MNSKINTGIALLASAFFLWSCGNNATEKTERKDSTTSSTTGAARDTMNAMTHQADTAGSSMNTGGGMMGPMQSTMSKMQSMNMTGDFDVDFANMMIEHHQGGIDMAQMEVSQGKNEKLKAKAREIIDKQKKEQQELKDFVTSYKPSGMKHGEGELQKSMQSMMGKMKGMPMSGDTDKDFAMMMTHHHEHGIAMNKMEQQYGMSDKLKQMAKKSTGDQQKDIAELKRLSAAQQ